MPDIQDVFKRINEQKKERKKVADIYKQALANSKAYQDSREVYEQARTKKIQVETAIRAECRSEIEQMEKIQQNMESDKILLSDMALTSLMKGQPIELKDEYDTAYEPIFKVNFKKIG